MYIVVWVVLLLFVIVLASYKSHTVLFLFKIYVYSVVNKMSYPLSVCLTLKVVAAESENNSRIKLINV